MGEIVVKVLCKEDLDDAAKKLRDQLLDKLEVGVTQYLQKVYKAHWGLFINVNFKFILNPSKTLCTVDNADTRNDNSIRLSFYIQYSIMYVYASAY